MSANPFIELVARLKKDEASIDLIKKDVESIASILNRQQALKVVCHIDTGVTKHLQGELNQLSKNLNLNVGVNTQGVNNSTTTNIKVDSTGAKKQADELTNILTQQLQGKASNSIANFVDSIRTQLDDSSKIWTTWSRTAEGALTDFTVSIQKAEGEVNKFKFLVNGDEFTLLGSTGGNKGELQNAEKILKFIDEYKAKINSLKAESNQNLTTVFQGGTVGFASLLEDLEKLKSGQGSIEDIRAKFVALKKEQIALEREQNNKRSQYMSDITSAYSRMNSEYSKLYSSKSSEDEKKAAQERINWNQEIINKSIQALETENIITQKNRDKIAQLKEINLQKQEAVSLDSINKQALEDEKVALSTINNIYSERSKQFKTLFSSSASESDKIFAQKQLDELTTWLTRIKEAFTEEGKINERIKGRIELKSEELQIELEQLNIKKQNEQAEQKAAQEQAKLNAERERGHIYWQGKFENSVKSLTAENTELKQMKQYYEDLNKQIEKTTNAESKDLNNKVQQYVSGYQKLSELYVKLNSADTSYKTETDRNKDKLEYEETAKRLHLLGQIIKANQNITEQQQKQIDNAKVQYTSSRQYVENRNKELSVAKEIKTVNEQNAEEAKRIQQEDKKISDTIITIEKGYEKLSKLYKDMTSSTKNTFDKDEAARKHEILQSELQELTKIALANDRISKEQIKQINNAKAQYQAEESRRNQYIQRLADEQKESSIKKANAETEKRNAKELNDLVEQYVQGYAKLKTLYDNRVSAPTDKERSLYVALKGTLIYLEDILSTNDKISAKQRERIANSKAEFQNHVIIAAQEKKEAEVVKEIASQTQTTKSAISDLDKIINNSDKVLKSQNKLATSIGSTNGIENLRTEFERTIKDAETLKQEYQKVSKTIGQDNSDKAIQKTNEDLRLMATELSDIDKKVKDTQLLFEQLNVIADAWKKIELYNSKLLSGNLTTEDVNQYNKQIEAERKIAIQARQKLETAGLYTSEIEKQTNYIKAQSESIIKSRQDQQKSSEQEAENTKILEANLKVIKSSYKEIADLTKIIKSNETTDSDKAKADNRLREQYKLVDAARARLQLAGLYNDQVQNEIKQGQEKIKQVREEVQLINENIQKRNQTESLRQQEAEYKKLTQTINGYINALSTFNNSNLAIKNNNDSRVSAQVATNNNLLSQLNTFSQSLKSDNSATNISRISTAIENLTKDLQQATDSSKQLNQALKTENAEARFDRNLQVLTNRVEIFAATNRKAITSLKTMRNNMTFADEWNRIVTTLRSGNLDGSAIERLTADFRNFKGEADSANLTASRFFTSMQTQLRMVLQRWISLYAVIGYIRKMIDNIKELDTAMINLQRVTHETGDEYEKFLANASDRAKELKTTTSALIEQSYQWAKLGYDMEKSLKLSEASTIFSRVADVGQEQALKNLVTAMKAYGIEAEDVMSIVDKLDKLNNEYAVSAAGLGDGLERAASAMAMTGNSLDQTLAMLTGAGEITQNLENTANGLRIVGLRLQGMKGKLEELNEPVDDLMEVSKVQTQILNLTKNQVDIFDQETKEFRAPYDILADISAIWKDLSSTTRASLTEILFGKNRANVGLALIQSFQSGQVQAAYKDLGNAAGTALEENEKLMNNVQAAMDDFKRAFQDLSNALMKSDGLKFIINSARTILDLITQIGKTFGSLPTVIAPVIALISGKSGISLISIISRIRGKNINEVATAINGVATAETNAAGATVALGQAETATSGATKTLAVSLKALGSALLTGLAISTVIWGIQKIIEKFTEAKKQAEELREQGIQAAKAYKEEKESMESLETQYTNLIASTTDVTEIRERLLSLQDQMKDKYGEEAEGIDLVNGKLSENLALQERIKKANAEEYVTVNRAAYNQAKKDLEKEYGYSEVLQPSGQKVLTPTYMQKYYTGYHFKGRFTDEEWNALLNVAPEMRQGFQGYGKSFALTGTLEEQLESLKKIRDEYSKIGSDDKIRQQLEADYQALKKTVDEAKNVVQAFEDNIKTIQEDVTIANDFTVQRGIDQIQAQYIAFQNAVKEGKFTDAIDIKSGIEFLQDVVKNQLDEGSDSYNTVMQFFSMIDLNINNISDDITAFQTEFNNFVEKTFGDATKEIDEVDSALGKLFEGKTISHADAWKIFGYDTDNILKDVEIVNGEYKFSIEQTIELRNRLIGKIKEQAIEERKEIERKRQIAEADLEYQRNLLAGKIKDINFNVNSASDIIALERQKKVIEDAEKKVKDYNVLWSRNELLIRQLNSRLTQTRDETESIKNQTSVLESQIKNIKTDIEELNKVADGLLKAQETAIDNITDGYEKQKEEIEKAKTALEEQLTTLEEQKTNLEDIIKNYETVNSVVQETVKDQISQIEESRKATEEYYDNLINNLKTENEEREDALTYAEKLAALENAQKNKKRIYSSARGWTYESDISAINAAQNDLTSFENEQAIKKLEEEREKALLPYDSQIKAYEDYAKQWEDVTTSVSKLEDEKLAQDILGADWRQKINEQDIDLLTDYSKAYSSYNTQLKSLTNNEISSLKSSIVEREKQIKAIDSEIKKWNDYKNEVTKTANSIKSSFDDANQYLYTAMVNENSTLQERQNNINNFANNYRNAIQSITDKQNEVERLQQALNNLNDTKIDLEINASNIQSAAEALERAAAKLFQSTYDLGRTMAESILKIPIFGSHANGGVVDYTGTAMMHGTKQKSEVVFNAADASKLYQYVHTTPNLIANAISNAGRLNMAMNRNSSISNNNGVTISHMTVVANNPTEFSRAFQREMSNYLDLSFMASKVK